MNGRALTKTWINMKAFVCLRGGVPRELPFVESMRLQRINEWWGYRPFFHWDDDTDPLTFVVEFFYWRFQIDVYGECVLRRQLGIVPPAYVKIWERRAL